MTSFEHQDLTERLDLIESMIAQGRRTTESWGWTFVLWGVAYYIAIAWASLGHGAVGWPVTMVTAGLLTAVVASRQASKSPETTLGRSMMAIWLSMGISTFVVMLSLGISGRIDLHISVAIIGSMLGAANAASSIILKWKMQFACALMWWAATVASLFGTEYQAGIEFLIAIFFCQIVFGIYGMVSESRNQKAMSAGQGASHA